MESYTPRENSPPPQTLNLYFANIYLLGRHIIEPLSLCLVLLPISLSPPPPHQNTQHFNLSGNLRPRLGLPGRHHVHIELGKVLDIFSGILLAKVLLSPQFAWIDNALNIIGVDEMCQVGASHWVGCQGLLTFPAAIDAAQSLDGRFDPYAESTEKYIVIKLE